VEAVPLDDRGLLLGDGLFETLLAEAGRLAGFETHAERLIRGCAVLALPAPAVPELKAAAEAAIAAAGLGGVRAAVRLTWTAGSGGRGLERPGTPAPRLFAAAAPAPASDRPARLASVAVRRNERSPASRLKTLSYLDNVIARRQAVAVGADEALMLNTAGEVAGGAAANLFWVQGDRLFTPAPACGVLDGVVRGRVLEAARRLGVRTVEAHAGPETLLGAEGVFLTNSLIGVRPIAAIDGRSAPTHPLVAQLAVSC
jgi:branched-chain amino acid aminotransferase/4-amino-4-deoxychorismate lyase